MRSIKRLANELQELAESGTTVRTLEQFWRVVAEYAEAVERGEAHKFQMPRISPELEPLIEEIERITADLD
jgi:hypothetical protein